jgi:glycosyltransferase involved in cell wall biosynthesis
MDILLVSTSDINGGAARSAYRLHEGLQKIGENSQMLVLDKSSDDKKVLAPKTRISQGMANAKIAFDAFPLKKYNHALDSRLFSLQWFPDKIASKTANLSVDIINLHWISAAFMRIETIAKFKRPLIWTLHDMWAFTGGCHYTEECEAYKFSCGNCPQLGNIKDKDYSRWVWERKDKAWQNLDITIVSPSLWLRKCAAASSLFRNKRIEIIPYGIDTQKYRPIPKHIAREILKLPQDKHIVLFGTLKATSEKRKGFHFLQPALEDLSKSGWQDKLEVVIFGASEPDNQPDFGFRTHYLGTFRDDLSLALVYSAADVFVLPSSQDNLPNTIMEANACGTPCVAFNVGGMPDMIEHQKNGYLAQPFKTEDLAEGIAWVLTNPDRYKNLSDHAREKVEKEFTLEKQAYRYQKLYKDILTQNTSERR